MSTDDVLHRIDAAVNDLCPCGAPPRSGSTYCSEDCEPTHRGADTISDVDGIKIRDLYEDYPTLSINVEREQADLLAHDVVVFQHPFYWYSCPAILKEWQDLVLEHGWAYGKGGHELKGKITLNAITTGGPESAYAKGGYNRFTIRELLAPFDQTAHLCGMRFLAPFVVHAALRIASQVGEALEILHHNRILHGQLGPESVLLVKEDDGGEHITLVGAELTAGYRTPLGRRRRETSPPPTFLERWLMLIVGGVLLLVIGLLGALLVFRLKHNRARAVSGDEAGQAFAAGDDDPAERSSR